MSTCSSTILGDLCIESVHERVVECWNSVECFDSKPPNYHEWFQVNGSDFGSAEVQEILRKYYVPQVEASTQIPRETLHRSETKDSLRIALVVIAIVSVILALILGGLGVWALSRTIKLEAHIQDLISKIDKLEIAHDALNATITQDRTHHAQTDASSAIQAFSSFSQWLQAMASSSGWDIGFANLLSIGSSTEAQKVGNVQRAL